MTTDSLEQPPEKLVMRPRKGRPSKKSAERCALICQRIKEGLTLQASARASGVGLTTIYEWQDNDPQFRQAIEEAEAEAEAMLIKLALEGAKKDGRIALMMLERRYSHWRKREEHAHVHATPQILKELVDSRRERDRKLLAEQAVIDV